jgi:hypothetical protein
MKLLLCFYLHILTFGTQADQIDLFIMAGQSNMQGWRSDAADYPSDPKYQDMNIPFYFEALNYSSSNKKWGTLGPQLGHFKNGHFGPEVSFARALQNTELTPAIFKYSSGGTSIKMSWKAPGQNGLYDDMVRNLNKAIHLLRNQGHTVIPRAFIWIQGESDAESVELANEYYWRLKKMLSHLRSKVLKKPTLPVILSVDEQHPHVKVRTEVVNAQIRLANEDPSISFMSMNGLEKYDVTHLTAKGTIRQGMRLYNAYKNTQ